MIRFAAWLWLASSAIVAGFMVSGPAYFVTVLVTIIATLRAFDAHAAWMGARLAKKQVEQDKLLSAHAAAHDAHGNTIHIYLPRECPYEVFDRLMDGIADEVLGTPRDNWDPFVWSHAGMCDSHGSEAITNEENTCEH